ncbi:PREDICTED: xyloglucan galactosyltransferase MUR3-like [Nelumbo nucifera]|uniref:Xyloglucan galactosyltransferase MUR3-like n=2 Tax=Nelumbo nucifera TaxID=4432 RepID=A0A1U7ZRN2_NELNU|nr:PREDICTED: xyloglucan galactosyltransferase MUR3-like [Nelumbo nucifera]DAD26446.1 TPA_asm: hypothetical protein HUJ06_027914 [Nelumbo nucifera]
MEKLNVGKCHIRFFWFFISLCFALSFLFLYFSSVTLFDGKSRYDYPVLSPYSNLMAISENDAKPITRSPATDHVMRNQSDSIDRVTVTNEALPMEEKGDEPVEDKPVKETSSIDKSKRSEPADERLPITENTTGPDSDICSGRYVYLYDLPSRFNDEIIKDCRSINLWYDMCRALENGGLGPQLVDTEKVFSHKSWYVTDQFTLEVIFHERIKHYKCLTNDSSLASAFYVPFYAGLDVSRYLWGFNTSMRDSAALALMKWLTKRDEWKLMWGRDHFLVAGRITWDFRRLTEEDQDWGSKLMILPEAKNMSVLVIESSPWHRNDFAIPYPTYFHPSRDNEISQWQNRMRRLKRRFLFCFAGAPRPNLKGSIRGDIIDQCIASRRRCRLLSCDSGGNKCQKPSHVMKLFQSSVFCLQPSGDSYTRKSAFDSMLAGCIPVFFHPGSAYVQYLWHLPKNYSRYSVFISENDVKAGKVNIEERLLRIPRDKVKSMREKVIQMIPRLIYADPRSGLQTIEDAFDLAVQGVIGRVNKIRRGIRDGPDSEMDYREDESWKYRLFGNVERNEWSPFFTNWKDSDS